MENHTKKTYTFGTWNVCGLNEKRIEAFNEIRRENEDVVVLTETKLRGVVQEEFKDYIHLQSGITAGVPRAGVSILIKKELANDLKWESVNERLIKAVFNIRGQNIVVIGVYGVDDCSTAATKDKFQSSLKSVLGSVAKDHELIVLGDFNSRVGTDENSSVVGRYGEIEINNNGRRLIEVCKEFNLKIQNTFFKHEDKHKYTWYHARQPRKTIIDFCITRQNTSLLFEDVLACRWLDCGTDHIFLEATLSFQHNTDAKEVKEEDHHIEIRRYRTYLMYSKSIRTSYKDFLENEINVAVPQTTEEMYQHLKTSIHAAAFNVLELEKHEMFGEILWDQEIRDLRQERNIRNKIENVTLESKFANKSQLSTVKNEVWVGICSTIDNTDKYRRNKIIWHILKDLQNKSSIIEHGDEFNYDTIRKTDETEPTEYSVNSSGNSNERNLDNFLHVGITDVCKALNQLEDCNCPVPGGLQVQFLKYSSNKAKVLLTNIIQNIFNGETIPTEITEVYTDIRKSCNEVTCTPQHNKCCMHSIMRVMREIAKNMLEKSPTFEETCRVLEIEPHLNAAFTLRQVLQKRVEKKNPAFHFVLMDLGKCFFQMNFSKLTEILCECDIPNKLIAVIKRLYQWNRMQLIELGPQLERLNLTYGLVRDFGLSNTLLKMYLKDEIKAWREDNLDCGIEIDGEKLLSLFLTDCKLLIFSESKRKMEIAINNLRLRLKNLDLIVNLKEVKYLGKGNLEISDDVIVGQDVMDFCDFLLELDGRNTEEVFQRILDARKAIGILHPVARDAMISRKNKKRIFTSVIRSILLYGCETWIITKDLKNPFEDTELIYWKWCCENYPIKYTKQEIYDIMNIREGISRIFMLKKAAWYASIMQIEHFGWCRSILYWEPEGTLKPGRPRKKWMDGLQEFLKEFQNHQIYFQKNKRVRRRNTITSLRNVLTEYDNNQTEDNFKL